MLLYFVHRPTYTRMLVDNYDSLRISFTRFCWSIRWLPLVRRLMFILNKVKKHWPIVIWRNALREWWYLVQTTQSENIESLPKRLEVRQWQYPYLCRNGKSWNGYSRTCSLQKQTTRCSVRRVTVTQSSTIESQICTCAYNVLRNKKLISGNRNTKRKFSSYLVICKGLSIFYEKTEAILFSFLF